MFSNKLKEIRKSKGLSMEELCNAYNKKYNGKMNKSTLSRYENNLQEPMLTVVKNLSEILNVNINSLTNDVDISHFNNIRPIEVRRIPLLGEIACGEPIFANEDFESYVECGTEIKADFALKCIGNSMVNARIFDGDIVFIHSQPNINNGEIAAVVIDDTATLKRVYKGNNRVTLMAENADYAPLVYVGEELDHINILGKAVAFQGDIK